MIYSELYEYGREVLSRAEIPEAALDSRLLLEFICGTDRNTLYAHPEMEVSEENRDRFLLLVEKRSGHIPLWHIIGEAPFMGLTFAVNGDVLIPRADTEILCEEAMKYIDDGMRVLDLCTGSGCIILSLMNYKNNLVAVGTDISEKALEVAKKNAGRLFVGINGGSVAFLRGDLYEALECANDDADDDAKIDTDDDLNAEFLPDTDASAHVSEIPQKFDVIVSNPPYIRDDVIPTLMPEVKDHDPYIALSGGADGLDFYRRIIDDAPKHLCSEGRIFLEIGYDQGEDVSRLLQDAGFRDIHIVKDYSGLDRVVWAVCGK